MKDWKTRLDEFLKFNDRAVLPGAGKISHEKAEALAEKEYTYSPKDAALSLRMRRKRMILKQLEAVVKKLPKRKKPKKGKP